MISKDHRFSSERLSYRGISEADTPLIVAWRSDPENYRWFFSQTPVTLEGHLAWYRRYLEDPTRFDFMVLDGGGTPIGTAGLSGVGSAVCEVSYMVGERSARGRGYATEMVRSMCGLAFDSLGATRVEARILPGNEASVRTALSAGLAETELVYAIERDG